MELINCACDELASYYRKLPGNKERAAEQLWMDRLASLPQKIYPEPLICSDKRPQGTKQSAWDFVKNPTTAPDEHETVIFEDPVVLLTRKDDHNPFFQLSNTVNAWIMIKALEWDITRTRVIHLDGGFVMPYDDLQKNMLGPKFEIIDGATLIGKRVHFRGDVLLPPIERLGPIMECLGIDEPCHDSELVRTFRAESLLAFNVTPEVERELGVTRIRPMYVTVITRRPYAGRELQRLWLNEDEVMRNMRKDYKDLNVQFRSIDYVNLTLHEQMTTTIESDMIVSMHGAGLVNVLWTRPMTTVVEIFPKKRLRYGYRNICQHVGCDWHEFRGGEDIGKKRNPNSKNKRIPYAEWKDYFHPLFQKTYGAFEEQQAVLRGEAS
uniref:Glycosyltransferase 61 catalytic domain-containing protein n=1 Tax=Hyaloperonospora arabidopsidis (strain Emoy2) TaxID=559515 RepID=M4B9Q1_HYAAE